MSHQSQQQPPLSRADLIKTQGLIGGQWVDADSGAMLAVINPANQSVVAEVADMGAAETERAIAAAEQALPAWRTLGADQRSDVLYRWYELVMANKAELGAILTLEQGKPLAEAQGEIQYGASYIKWFAEEARRIYGDVLPHSQNDRRHLVIKQPVGVVAAITPWNFPNAMLARKLAPALAAGCTIVCKPAAETPLSALALAYLAELAGVPAGVINVVVGQDAPAIGTAITTSPVVRKLSFTGSTAVGKLLMTQCAGTVKRTSMELGGNAPIIIFDDADLDQAVHGAMLSKFRNAGQTCICSNRLLVQSGIYPAFIERFSAELKKLAMGDGMTEGTSIGPLITATAVTSVSAKVDEAVAQGADKIVLEQSSAINLSGSFYPPTILTDVNTDMRVFKEEIFGPVAPVFRFDTEDEAIHMANETEYGLASYLYTQNLSRIWRVSEAIDYGMVGVNETAISSALIPFGGMKESGQGREGSRYGLDDYLETKYICMGGLN